MTIAFVLLIPPQLLAQTIEIVVQGVPPSGPVIPIDNAVVRASQSPNQQSGTPRPPVRPVPPGTNQNVYLLSPAALGSPIDITVQRTKDYHSWVVNDIYLTPGQNQRIEVQLFHFGYPIRAPQCFALKTQYERLFRKEQQLNPDKSLKQIEHLARLKYADAIFALPNPNREHLQSPQTRQMLKQMPRDQHNDLQGMMNGLFDLYELDDMAEYIPSEWDTNYIVNGEPIPTKVRLLGTHGTYENRAGKHLLEKVDIFYSDQDDGHVITGTFRYRPGTPDEKSNSFRWKLSDEGNEFSGTGQWSGKMIRGPGDDRD
jgi:hypothetical protein